MKPRINNSPFRPLNPRARVAATGPYAVACPYCRQPPGEVCVNQADRYKDLKRPHPERRSTPAGAPGSGR